MFLNCSSYGLNLQEVMKRNLGCLAYRLGLYGVIIIIIIVIIIIIIIIIEEKS